MRGSTGYGKTYVALDNGMKREDSVKDIGALLDWIATQPDLDAKRVVVIGGSYGGYMVLASMTHYNDRLRGAIDIVGISNFVTFLESTAEYRRDLRRPEYGDERDPKMREFLQKISPLNNAGKINKPMLVVQGQNDPRVPVHRSRADGREDPRERRRGLVPRRAQRRPRLRQARQHRLLPVGGGDVPGEAEAVVKGDATFKSGRVPFVGSADYLADGRRALAFAAAGVHGGHREMPSCRRQVLDHVPGEARIVQDDDAIQRVGALTDIDPVARQVTENGPVVILGRRQP